jgi:hypothetical protein
MSIYNFLNICALETDEQLFAASSELTISLEE